MAHFECNNCKQVYEDYMPIDDTCIKCKKGLVRITEKPLTALPFDINMEGRVLHLGIQRSRAGYYLGWVDMLEGPIDRVTGYMLREDLEKLLERIMEDERIHTLCGVGGDEYYRKGNN